MWLSKIKVMSVFIIGLSLGTFLIISVGSDKSESRGTIYVDDDADSGWYDATHVKTIQEGIDNATEEDTIYVYSGIYQENIIINKSVDVFGADKNITIIDGMNSGDGIKIEEKQVNLSNFTIRNCTMANNAGIKILNSKSKLHSVDVNNCTYGIYLHPITHDYSSSIESMISLDHCSIHHNTLDGVYANIALSYSGGYNQGWTADYTIDVNDSSFVDNGASGVFLRAFGKTTQGYHNIDIHVDASIRNCTISNNGIGVNTSYYESGPDCYVNYNLDLNSTSIKNNTLYGIQLDNIAINEFNCAVKNNGVFDYQGYCHTQGNWKWKEQSTYNFTNTIKINDGHTLFIQPGTVVQFQSLQSQLFVEGKIIANGTSQNPIMLTQTNQKNRSLWGGVVFEIIDDYSFLSYVTISHAEVGLLIESSTISADHVHVFDCEHEGIKIKNSHISLLDSTVNNSESGIYIYPSPNGKHDNIVSTIQLNNCSIHHNTLDGVYANIALSYSGGYNQGWTADYTIDVNDSSFVDNGASGVFLRAFGKTTQWYHNIDIHVDASIRNCTISNNDIGVNTSYYESGPDCYVAYDMILHNSTVSSNSNGIMLIHSQGNIIFNNTIENNNLGITIDTSSENTYIYGNKFIDNVNQSYDEGINYWNKPYPIGGNYWSDFDEESEGAYDMFSGPNQNITGSDGIIDSSYNITGGNNKDYYPLKNQIVFDDDPPIIIFENPNDDNSLFCNSITISSKIIDDSDISDCWSIVNGTRFNFTNKNDSTYNWHLTSDTIGLGQYQVIIHAIDKHNNHATVTRDFAIINHDINPDNPNDADQIRQTLFIPENHFNNPKLFFNINNTWTQQNLTHTSTDMYTNTFGPVAPQTLNYKIQATSKTKATTYISENMTLLINNSDIFPPSISLNSITQNATIDDPLDIILSFYDQSPLNQSSISLQVSMNNGKQYQSLNLSPGYPGFYHATINSFPENTSSLLLFTSTAADIYGNNAIFNFTYEIDTQRPVIIDCFGTPSIDAIISSGDDWNTKEIIMDDYIIQNQQIQSITNTTGEIAFTRNQTHLTAMIIVNQSLSIEHFDIYFDNNNDFILTHNNDTGIRVIPNGPNLDTYTLTYENGNWKATLDPSISAAFTTNGQTIIETSVPLSTGLPDENNRTKAALLLNYTESGNSHTLVFPGLTRLNQTPTQLTDLLTFIGINNPSAPKHWLEIQFIPVIIITEHIHQDFNPVSQGNQISFKYQFYNFFGRNITEYDTLQSVSFTLKNPENTIINLGWNQTNHDFHVNYTIPDNATEGVWTLETNIKDESGNTGIGQRNFVVLDPYLLQFFTTETIYYTSEEIPFYLLVSTYENPGNFFDDNQVTVNFSIFDEQNIGVYQTTMTSSIMDIQYYENATVFSHILPSGMLPIANYTAHVIVQDNNGTTVQANYSFSITKNITLTLNLEKTEYVRQEIIRINGTVTQNGAGIPDALVELSLTMQNITIHRYATTTNQGTYEYYFDPSNIYVGTCTIEASIIYHQRKNSENTTIIIHGMYAVPSTPIISFDMRKGQDGTGTIVLYNVGETPLTNILNNIDLIDENPSDPVTCTLNTTDTNNTIQPGESTQFDLLFETTDDSPDDATFTVNISNDQNSTETRIIHLTLHESLISELLITPNNIDINLNPGSYATIPVTLTNNGYGTLSNLSISTPTNHWIHVSTNNIGDLTAHQIKTIDIIITPPDNQSIGSYTESLIIQGTNHGPYEINIAVNITTDTTGDLLFIVKNEIEEDLPNTLITIYNQTHPPSPIYHGKTNNTGHLIFTDLPSGKYSYSLSSSGHTTVTGTTQVEPGKIKLINITLFIEFMEYNWQVTPFTFTDEYHIQLEMTYRTDIDAPALSFSPPYFQFDVSRAHIIEHGYTKFVNLKIFNFGNTAIYNLSLQSWDKNGYSVEPLLLDPVIDSIDAKSYVEVPYRFSIDQGTHIPYPGRRYVAQIPMNGIFYYYSEGHQYTGNVKASVPIFIRDVSQRSLLMDPPFLMMFRIKEPEYVMYHNLQDLIQANFQKTQRYLETISVYNIADDEYVSIQPIAAGPYITVKIDLFTLGLSIGGLGTYTGIVHTKPGTVNTLQITQDKIINIEYGNHSWGDLLTLWAVYQSLDLPWEQLEPNWGHAYTDIYQVGTSLWVPTDLLSFPKFPGLEFSPGFMFYKYQYQYDTYPRLKLYLIYLFELDLGFGIPCFPFLFPAEIDDLEGYNPPDPTPDQDNDEFLTLPDFNFPPWPKIKMIQDPKIPYQSPQVVPPSNDNIIPESTIPYVRHTPHNCIRLRLSQRLTMEREGFLATLEITNKLFTKPIEDVNISIIIVNGSGGEVTEHFFINITDPSFQLFISGSGTISPQQTAMVQWMIIPEYGMGGSGDNGTIYYAYAIIDSLVLNQNYSVTTYPAEFIVTPMPLLVLDYFLPTTVYGDDPLTNDTEPAIPFKLAVKITNVGNGTARNLSISSSQFIILEDNAWKQIYFELIGSYLNGQNYSNSTLTIDFGDIEPGEHKIGYWVITCSQNGDFTDFDASYTHKSSYGGEQTSLIKNIYTHLNHYDNAIFGPHEGIIYQNNGSSNDLWGVDLWNGTTFQIPTLPANITHIPSNDEPYLDFCLNDTAGFSGGWFVVYVNDPFENEVAIKQTTRNNTTIDPRNDWVFNNSIFILDQLSNITNICYRTEFYTVSITSYDGNKTFADHLYRNDHDSNRDYYGTNWTLDTNATFLYIGPVNGLLEGTPAEEDIGRYWVNITVHYGKMSILHFTDYHNFTLHVLPEGIYLTSLKTGWNFVSIPCNVSIPLTSILTNSSNSTYSWSETILRGIINQYIFGWNRIGQYYDFANTLNPGYGYWVYSHEDCELWIESLNPVFDDYITVVEPYWNLVSVPFDQQVDKIDLLVDDVSWSTAVSNGWISDFVFGWNRASQNYEFSDTFNPGYAYWLYSYQQCTLERNS